MPSLRIHRVFITTIASGGAAVTYTISGTVYDADGSTAVAGATVALGALSAVSAANGTYIISDVPAGTSGSMTCTKVGYSWTAITVAAMSGNLTSQNYANAWWAAGGCAASCVRAYRAKGAASLAASYVNLANPGTGDAAPGVAPTFAAATGWTFNGTTQYLTTSLTIANTSVSVFVGFTGAASQSGSLFGFESGGQYFTIINAFSDDDSADFYNAGVVRVLGTNAYTSGVLGVAGKTAYRGGSSVGTIGAGTYTTTAEAYIGGRNPTVSLWNKTITAISFYSAIVTAPQAAAVSAAIAALP